MLCEFIALSHISIECLSVGLLELPHPCSEAKISIEVYTGKELEGYHEEMFFTVVPQSLNQTLQENHGQSTLVLFHGSFTSCFPLEWIYRERKVCEINPEGDL